MKARRVKHLDPDGPLADNIARIIEVRLDELCGFMPRASDPTKVTALHDMRIAAKRLRYLLELFAPSFGPYAATAAKKTKTLQDLLGELHDCDVHLPRVRELVDDLLQQDARTVRRLAGDADDVEPALVASVAHVDAYRGLATLSIHLQARRALLFDRFLALWLELTRQGFRGRLEYALTERPPVAEEEPDGAPAGGPSPAGNGASASEPLPSEAASP